MGKKRKQEGKEQQKGKQQQKGKEKQEQQGQGNQQQKGKEQQGQDALKEEEQQQHFFLREGDPKDKFSWEGSSAILQETCGTPVFPTIAHTALGGANILCNASCSKAFLDTIGNGNAQWLKHLLQKKTKGEVLEYANETVKGKGTTGSNIAQKPAMIRDDDIEAARTAFKGELVGADAVISYIAGKLKRYAEVWDPTNFHAPYASAVQGSGWGKSRIMTELWRKDVYVVYLSTLPEEQTGFPRRTKHLADVICNKCVDEADIVAVIVSSLSVLLNKQVSAEVWIQNQLDSDDVYENIYEYQKVVQEIRTSTPAKPDVSNLNAHAQVKEYGKYYRECCKAYGKFLLPILEKIKLKIQGLVLFCFDEAGALASMDRDGGGTAFLNLRRALVYCPTGFRLFSIVLGTDSRIANYSPAHANDPSSRVRLLSDCNKLYEPIYLIGVSDVLVKRGQSSSTLPDTEQAMRFGRPLWGAYMESTEPGSKVIATINLAKKKLLGKDVNFDTDPWVSKEVALGVFACTIGLDVVAWSTLAQDLVARHMRTVISVSGDRSRVYTASACEPVLAAAAGMLLHRDKNKHLTEFLDRLVSCCLDGLVLEGVRGELVTRIILLFAMHKCMESSSTFIETVPMKRFLEVLFGEDIVQQLENNCADLEGDVFFNAFIPTTAQPSDELMKDYFVRCAAVISRRNEKSVDAGIPWRKTDVAAGRNPQRNPARECRKAFTSYDVHDKTPVYLGFPNETKNRRGDSCVTKAKESIDADERVTKTYSCVMQVGSKEDKFEVEGTTVMAFGIAAYTFLGQEVIFKLQILAATCEDVFKTKSLEEQEILRGMLPLTYR